MICYQLLAIFLCITNVYCCAPTSPPSSAQAPRTVVVSGTSSNAGSTATQGNSAQASAAAAREAAAATERAAAVATQQAAAAREAAAASERAATLTRQQAAAAREAAEATEQAAATASRSATEAQASVQRMAASTRRTVPFARRNTPTKYTRKSPISTGSRSGIPVEGSSEPGIATSEEHSAETDDGGETPTETRPDSMEAPKENSEDTVINKSNEITTEEIPEEISTETSEQPGTDAGGEQPPGEKPEDKPTNDPIDNKPENIVPTLPAVTCQELCQLSDLENFDSKLQVQLQGHECAAAGAVALIRCGTGDKIHVGLTNKLHVSVVIAACSPDTGAWVDVEGNPFTSLTCQTCEAVQSCSAETYTLFDNNLSAKIIREDCVKEGTQVAFNCLDQSPLQVTAANVDLWVESPHQTVVECKNGELKMAGSDITVQNIACTECEASCTVDDLKLLDSDAELELMNNAACGFTSAIATISCPKTNSIKFAVTVGERSTSAEGSMIVKCTELGWTTLSNEPIIKLSCDACSHFEISEDASSTVIGSSCFVFEPTLFDEEDDFDQARKSCETNGGRLAWVDSKYKLDSLVAAFLEPASLLVFDEAWVGLQQNYGAQNVKEWRFVSDGSSAYYSEGHILPWAIGQPDDTEDEDDEGALSFLDRGLVDMNQYEQNLPYICEYVDAI